MNDKSNSLTADTEKVLVVWIEDQTSQIFPWAKVLPRGRPLTLFSVLLWRLGEVKKLKEKCLKVAEFGSWNRQSSHFHNMKIQGKAASDDLEATASYPKDLTNIINKGGYTQKQILNVDETPFHWKKMPSRTFRAWEEKPKPGFKASKYRLTLLLGANAAGLEVEATAHLPFQKSLGFP